MCYTANAVTCMGPPFLLLPLGHDFSEGQIFLKPCLQVHKVQQSALEAAAMGVLQDAAQPGARAHGFVTGVQEYGVFVSFCNGVRGLAPTQQLGLEPNQDPAKQFPIGKV